MSAQSKFTSTAFEHSMQLITVPNQTLGKGLIFSQIGGGLFSGLY